MTSDRLQRLIALKRDQTTLGQIDYLDHLMTDTALFTQRPGDVERVAAILDHLIGRIVTAEPTTHAPQQPLDRSHTDENPHEAKVDTYGPERLTREHTA